MFTVYWIESPKAAYSTIQEVMAEVAEAVEAAEAEDVVVVAEDVVVEGIDGAVLSFAQRRQAASKIGVLFKV